MTKLKLIDTVWANLGGGFTKGQVTLLVNEVFEQIETQVLKGEVVKIKNFGTFVLSQNKARVRQLPNQKGLITIPPRYKLKFTPSANIANKTLKLR